MASICYEQFFHQICLGWRTSSRLFETLQKIRLKGASKAARNSPSPVQGIVHLQKNNFRSGICSLAYLLLTQVRKLPNLSRPANAQMGEFVVAGEIRFRSENETHLSSKRPAGNCPVLRVCSREWGIGFDGF